MNDLTRQYNQRGFTLMHMLVALPLLSVFLFIGSKLFITNNQLFREADNAEQRLIHTEQALKMLYTDIWLSAGLQLKDNRLTVKQSGGDIRWEIDRSGGLTRIGLNGKTRHNFNGIGTTAIEIRNNAVSLVLRQGTFLCPTSRAIVTTTGASQP
ncbi:MAG: hypothetical protein AAGI37_14525 [Planctomycetota bacterium]